MQASRLDELLWHQAPLPMAVAATSDHRFYNRVFVTVTDPAGSAALAMGMGVYKNMAVVDGFGVLALPDRQVNVRVSRPLGALHQEEVGGLAYLVTNPFHTIQLTLTGNHPLTYDLEWTARFPPIEEGAWWGTTNAVNERVAIDVRRYEQVGRVNGWIKVDGQLIEVRDWFGGRDHSWGVRGGVGGFEPDNGGRLIDGKGMLLAWFLFDCGEFSGVIARTEDDAGNQCGLDGRLVFPEGSGRPDLQIVDARLDCEFKPGSRYYRTARIEFRTADGGEWTLVADALPVAGLCRGGGYEGGWHDRKGLGLWRGDHVEHDVYRPGGQPHLVLVDNGTSIEHNQREQVARVTVSGPLGTHDGMGDCTLIARGSIPRLGLIDHALRL